jgi:hypothetical protein
LLGVLAGAVVVFVAASTLALAVASSGAALTVALGPVAFVAVEQSANGSETTFGPGLAVLAGICGMANLAAAAVLAARRR